MHRLLLTCLFSLAAATPDLLAREAPDQPLPRQKAYPWMTLDKWRAFHEADLARAQAGPVDLLFVGDSITEDWDKTGQAVWRDAFEPLRAANFGIGGDTTQNLLWRLTAGGALDHVRPRVVVVLIGTNNIGLHNDPPADVLRGIAAVVKTLRQRLPDAEVLLLDLFPRGASPDDAYRRAVVETNRGLARIGAGDDHVRHLRLWDTFLDERGHTRPDLMPDHLHLSPAGYRRWADALLPVLKEMRTANRN